MLKKPKKPRPDFPLFPHNSGQWAKKIRGRLFYFGVWADPEAALNKYLDEKDDRQAGREPRRKGDILTLRNLVNRFLDAKRLLIDTGELSPVTWRNYYDVCERLISFFGKERAVLDLDAHDFEKLRAELSKGRGAHSLASQIQKVRTLFKYAYDAVMIDRPVRFGPAFKKPSKKAIRKARHAAGSRMIEAAQLRKLLKAAKQPMRAIILLALNCGYGQSDCAALPIAAFDFNAGYVNFPRPKTAVMRRCPLWKETVKAVKEAIAMRPEAKDPADLGLVFITKYGKRWVRVKQGKEGQFVGVDSVNLEFKKLLKAAKIKAGGFYSLRHVHRTIADGAKDQPAANHIMGHIDDSMSEQYREYIDDKRLLAVVNVVRKWLFGK